MIDFPDLKNLMELYLGNNNVANSKEINNLKHLQKLIILDLSGNPFSRDENYRVYTLFVIKKLKVLDGISIEVQEQQMAKDLFTGRLTEEILQSRLFGQTAQKVSDLDLSNCKLRDFEDVFNHQHFPMLTELNLSQNMFTSTRMLGHLPHLKILILSQNKIDSLYYATDIQQKKGLNGCQGLEILDLSQNTLKDLHGL
jgi:Leucine-rich repeat (LRR) protein